jgi:hypothetical protein
VVIQEVSTKQHRVSVSLCLSLSSPPWVLPPPHLDAVPQTQHFVLVSFILFRLPQRAFYLLYTTLPDTSTNPTRVHPPLGAIGTSAVPAATIDHHFVTVCFVGPRARTFAPTRSLLTRVLLWLLFCFHDGWMAPLTRPAVLTHRHTIFRMSGQVINSGRSRTNRVEKVDKGGKGPAARLSNRCAPSLCPSRKIHHSRDLSSEPSRMFELCCVLPCPATSCAPLIHTHNTFAREVS